MKNKRGACRYYSDRIRLEKLKQKSLLLMLAAKLLGFLVSIALLYLRQI